MPQLYHHQGLQWHSYRTDNLQALGSVLSADIEIRIKLWTDKAETFCSFTWMCHLEHFKIASKTGWFGLRLFGRMQGLASSELIAGWSGVSTVCRTPSTVIRGQRIPTNILLFVSQFNDPTFAGGQVLFADGQAVCLADLQFTIHHLTIDWFKNELDNLDGP